MSVKLIASDLDGTLLTDDKKISEMTRQMISLAAGQGIQIVPATGRAFSSVPEEVLALPGVEYVITSNGAAIYSVSQGKRIYSCPLEAASVEEILTMDELVRMDKITLMDGRTSKDGIASMAGGQMYSCEALDGLIETDDGKTQNRYSALTIEGFIDGVPYSEASYLENPGKYGATGFGIGYVKRTRTPVQDIRSFLREHKSELDSLSVVSADYSLLAHCKEVMEKTIPFIQTTSSVPHLLEIVHARSGKGNTLSYLLDELGIAPEEAAAFGDAYNDLDMICLVKYGIAVGNAVETCKSAAYLVTDSNEEDGVAKAIRQII
ncbi:MAG: HAD hydrolase family protein [Lachnospiraceae bacterium]|nr:HAD hydrolase family protein [Lachnospiraceae bacterium]